MQNIENPTRPGSTARRLVFAGAASLLLATSAVFAPPAAQAHDGLIGTEPSNGAQLKEAPGSATLRFSGELKEIGSKVLVTDEDGASVESTPSVQGTTLEVAFDEELPAGEYTITWRVVSSDGHPIEGTAGNGEALRFAIQKGAASAPADPVESSAPATSAATASSTLPAQASSPATSDTAAAPQPAENDAPSPLPWVVVGVVVLAAAAYVLIRARRKGR